MREADKQMLADHYLDFYQIAFSILHNETDVEDAVQEALAITMFRSLTGDPSAYCIRVVRNTALKMRRKSPEVLLEQMIEVPEPEPEPDHTSRRLELLSSLREKLPKRIRNVLYLYYEKGLSKAQIAQHEGISESMVKKLFYKGHRRLKRKIIEIETKEITKDI